DVVQKKTEGIHVIRIKLY
ncbi:MAG: hypothetical protein QG666_1228, partial [Euryarchaeota archaeon]|nr:hypothetical protein [Euryarchaeota archaeon]